MKRVMRRVRDQAVDPGQHQWVSVIESPEQDSIQTFASTVRDVMGLIAPNIFGHRVSLVQHVSSSSNKLLIDTLKSARPLTQESGGSLHEQTLKLGTKSGKNDVRDFWRSADIPVAPCFI